MNAPLPPSIRVFERGWLSSNNVLLFDDDGSATLVDTGYVTHKEQTRELVRHALQGRSLGPHRQHAPALRPLRRQRRTAAGVRRHDPHPARPPDAVARWDEDELTFVATGQQCERFAYDGLIEPGSEIRMGGFAWRVHAASGHDPHSVVLWAPEPGVLISADALWQNGFGVIFPELEGESGFAEQRAILELIESLAPRLVIPGHGAPFTDVGAALKRAHARLDALSAASSATHATQPRCW